MSLFASCFLLSTLGGQGTEGSEPFRLAGMVGAAAAAIRHAGSSGEQGQPGASRPITGECFFKITVATAVAVAGAGAVAVAKAVAVVASSAGVRGGIPFPGLVMSLAHRGEAGHGGPHCWSTAGLRYPQSPERVPASGGAYLHCP